MEPVDPAVAIIAPEKLHSYLLSLTHPIGRYKAACFLSLGYVAEAWEMLEKDLRLHLSNPHEQANSTEFGQKFTTRGLLKGPNGREANICAVWTILNGEKAARFITAYPED